MRILMIAPTPFFSDRGCHVRIYEEARALKARNHEVVIVTYHLGRDIGGIPVIRIPNIPWYRKKSAGPSWHKPYLDILLVYKALAVSRKFAPHLVHAHLHEGAFLAAIAKRFFKVPIVFDCQGSLTGELLDHNFIKEGGALYRLFVRLESWITRKADHIVTSSTPVSSLIKKEYPTVAERLTPLVDAVDTENFKPVATCHERLRLLGIPSGKKIIVYLGAMTTYQGVDLLLAALKELADRRRDFHALLMGYPEADYLKKAKTMGLEDVTTFTGKIDYCTATDYLGLGDIAVSPKLSATEANGKLLNYLACGLPCVVFENPINRELLGNFGVYVEKQTANAFALGIEKLLDNPAICDEFATGGRAFAEQSHSWKTRIVQLEQVYRHLLTS